MIRFSALLVALAIGLLVAGVVASSLLMVYVSIAVCAVAALLLAAGVLWHWSDIFGGGEAQPVSSAASGPARAPAATPVPATPVPASPVSASPVPASTGTANTEAANTASASSPAAGFPAARRGRGRDEEADQPASPGPAAHPPDRSRWGDRRPGRKDPSGRPDRRPAEPAPPQAEQPVASRPDDLWERVNEELESAGKRDTGALSWPATDFTAIPRAAGEPAPPGRGEPSGLGSGVGEDLWQPAAGWQPPANPQLRWPTLLPATEPGTAGAGGPAGDEPKAGEPTAGEPGTAIAAGAPGEPDDRAADGSGTEPDAGRAEPDDGRADEPAASAAGDAGDREIRESPTGELQFSDLGASDLRARESSAVLEDAPAEDAGAKDTPAQDRPSGATPAMDAAGTGTAAETARDTDEDEDRAGDDAAATPDGAAAEDKAAGDSAPPWTIASWRAGPGPAAEKLAAEADEDAAPADEGATSADEDAAEDAAAAPEADKKPNPAEGWLAAGPAPAAAGAGARTGKPAQPAEAGPAAAGSAKPQATSQVEVTVVPGVARYHRNGCILIRFLGTDDLEVMPRPQAQDAGFAACRACQPDELPTG